MSPISILRVECMQCQTGPYNCLCRLTAQDPEDPEVAYEVTWRAYLSIGMGCGDAYDEHPTPERDGLPAARRLRDTWGEDAVLFGFADWVQLRAWMRPSSCAEPFFAAYWHIVEYHVTDAENVKFGGRQVMFNRDAATVVAYHTPTRTEEF